MLWVRSGAGQLRGGQIHHEHVRLHVGSYRCFPRDVFAKLCWSLMHNSEITRAIDPQLEFQGGSESCFREVQCLIPLP